MKKLDGIWKFSPDPNELGEEKEFYKPEFDDKDWLDAKVPGHWQEDVEGMRNYEGVAWYRTRFSYERERKDGIVWLEFGGVFYKAEVWLNGKKIGENEGYFFPFRFDVTDVIKEENVLAVKVTSRDERNINKKEQVAGVFYHWDCRDPTFNPGGIWRSVLIYETGYAYIERVKIIPKIKGKDALLKIILWIGSKKKGRAKLFLKIRPKNFEGEEIVKEKEIELDEGLNYFEEEILVKDAKLWWTWDLGEQYLYLLETEVSFDGELSDRKVEQFGIKELKLVKEGSAWVLYLNGKRFYARGTNYAPSIQRLARSNYELVKNDVKMMKEANMNMVRIHAHVDIPELYDALDEEGILAWQDMPLQWMYSKKAEKAALNSARKLVQMYENRASLGIICAHNEPFKFPTTIEFVILILGFIIGAFVSWIIGTFSITALRQPPFGPYRIPFWYDLIEFLATPLIPGFLGRFITYGTIISILLVIYFYFTPLAHAVGSHEALIFSIILGIIFPWDAMLILTLWLIATDNAIIAIRWNWNKDVLDKKLVKVIREEDRDVHPIVWYSGGFGWINKAHGTDIHIYDGWYSAFYIWLKPFKSIFGYRHAKLNFSGFFKHVPRFVTEYGAQSFPEKENFLKMLPDNLRKKVEEGKWPEYYDELAKYLEKYHQYQPFFMHQWLKPKKFKSLEEFIEATQEYQAELTKFYNEYWRSMKYRPCGGALQFMFTDTAPVIDWAVVDYWRKPKKAYYATKLSFEPVYAFIDWPKPSYKVGKDYRHTLYLVNDLYKKFKVKVEVLIEYESGDEEKVYEGEFELREDDYQKYPGEIKLRFKERGEHKIVIVLNTGEKEIRNEYKVIVKR